jgi:hypothetical protein
MRRRELTIPQVAFIAGTRAALALGVGLLLSEKISRPRRRAIGWSLVGFGVVTTIPAARTLFGERPAAAELQS